MKYLVNVGLLASLVVIVTAQGQNYGPNRQGGKPGSSGMDMFSGPKIKTPGGVPPITSQSIPQGLNLNPADYPQPSQTSSSSSSSQSGLDFSRLGQYPSAAGIGNLAAMLGNRRSRQRSSSNPLGALMGSGPLGYFALQQNDFMADTLPCILMQMPLMQCTFMTGMFQ